jgi:DNA polymerase elongation subunit (family B)
MSLQKMGEKIGLEKLPMPKEWTDDASEDAYCRRDVQIMVEMMKNWCDFLRREDMGAFRPTIAGQAMQTYRHKYMDYPILIDANEEALKVARNAYKGGRVEAGYIGHLTQAVHHLDINSMYPSVMAAHDFPTKLVQYTPFVSVRGLARLLQTHCVCAFVSLNTDEPFAPILFKHKLAFPVGKFDAYLSSPELEYALERGFISNIHVAAIYERAPIFKRFVRDLYQKKEQASLRGDTVERDHWKLVLNSFYGKWGQNGRHYWLYTDEPRPEFPTKFYVNFQSGKKTCFRYFGDYILASTNEAESRHSHPAIAAHVTAHARMVLYALIRELAPEHYFYSDTDAVFTSDTGLKRLRHRIDDTRLGLLKHVASYQDVWIYGAKDYVLDGERTLKGIRDDAEQLNETTFKQIRWFRLAGLARARSLDMPLTTVITKCLGRTYSKGVVLPSGFVRPLHAPEETS